MAKYNKVKAHHIKQGVTLWDVWAWVSRDGTSSTIHRVQPLRKPGLIRHGGGNLFFPVKSRSRIALVDSNIPENEYNLHRLFFKHKHALAYAERIKNRMFNSSERAKMTALLSDPDAPDVRIDDEDYRWD